MELSELSHSDSSSDSSSLSASVDMGVLGLWGVERGSNHEAEELFLDTLRTSRRRADTDMSDSSASYTGSDEEGDDLAAGGKPDLASKLRALGFEIEVGNLKRLHRGELRLGHKGAYAEDHAQMTKRLTNRNLSCRESLRMSVELKQIPKGVSKISCVVFEVPISETETRIPELAIRAMEGRSQSSLLSDPALIQKTLARQKESYSHCSKMALTSPHVEYNLFRRPHTKLRQQGSRLGAHPSHELQLFFSNISGLKLLRPQHLGMCTLNLDVLVLQQIAESGYFENIGSSVEKDIFDGSLELNFGEDFLVFVRYQYSAKMLRLRLPDFQPYMSAESLELSRNETVLFRSLDENVNVSERLVRPSQQHQEEDSFGSLLPAAMNDSSKDMMHISILGSDLMCLVLGKLAFPDLTKALRVCKSWSALFKRYRNRIISQDGFAKMVSFVSVTIPTSNFMAGRLDGVTYPLGEVSLPKALEQPFHRRLFAFSFWSSFYPAAFRFKSVQPKASTVAIMTCTAMDELTMMPNLNNDFPSGGSDHFCVGEVSMPDESDQWLPLSAESTNFETRVVAFRFAEPHHMLDFQIRGFSVELMTLVPFCTILLDDCRRDLRQKAWSQFSRWTARAGPRTLPVGLQASDLTQLLVMLTDTSLHLSDSWKTLLLEIFSFASLFGPLRPSVLSDADIAEFISSLCRLARRSAKPLDWNLLQNVAAGLCFSDGSSSSLCRSALSNLASCLIDFPNVSLSALVKRCVFEDPICANESYVPSLISLYVKARQQKESSFFSSGVIRRFASLALEIVVRDSYGLDARTLVAMCATGSDSATALRMASMQFAGKRYLIVPWLKQRALLEEDSEVLAGLKKVLSSVTLTAPNQSRKVAGAITSNLCTRVITGDTYTAQMWFHCETCFSGSSDYGVCISCAVNCHFGHNLRANEGSNFYCDCIESTCSARLPSDLNDEYCRREDHGSKTQKMRTRKVRSQSR